MFTSDDRKKLLEIVEWLLTKATELDQASVLSSAVSDAVVYKLPSFEEAEKRIKVGRLKNNLLKTKIDQRVNVGRLLFLTPQGVTRMLNKF